MLEMHSFLLKKIVIALILPPSSLLLLGLAGIWIGLKHPKTGRALTTLSLTTLLIFSLPVTGNALLKSLEKQLSISSTQIKEVQAIVILSGGINSNASEYANKDTVNRATLERLRYGARMQQETGLPILVTGGAPFGGTPEADPMAATLKDDFHANVIWIENHSKDTAENAEYSATILKQHGVYRIALISQAWHLPRAVSLFQKQGLTVYPAPTAYTNDVHKALKWLPNASALENSAIALKEYLGIFVNNFQ